MSEQISALVIARHAYEIASELPDNASQDLGRIDYVLKRQHALERVPGMMEEAETVMATDILHNLGRITLSHLNGEPLPTRFQQYPLFKQTEAQLDGMIDPHLHRGVDAQHFASNRFGMSGDLDSRFVHLFKSMELVGDMGQYWIFSMSALARHKAHTVEGINSQTGEPAEVNYFSTFTPLRAKEMLQTALNDLKITSHHNPGL